jgi:hypothetical protein
MIFPVFEKSFHPAIENIFQKCSTLCGSQARIRTDP